MELDGPAALVQLARDGARGEELSPLVDPAPLVVRWRAAPGDVPLRWLRTAPTVTVVVGDPAAVPADVAAAFDVCLTDAARPPRPWVQAPVAALADAVRAQPLAALALVALLRAGDGLDVWSGLAAESAAYAALLGSAAFQAWRAGVPPRRRSPPAGPPVLVDRAGARLSITLNRPEVHNAVDSALRDALVAALQLADADPSITAVDLRGAGPSFCSGGDLDEFGTVGDPATAHAVRLTRHPGWWAHRCRSRLTVAVHGACLGAGVELPAFASRVVASPDAWFALPELGMGLIPGAGGTVSIARRAGRHRLAWMALTGARVDAPTALRWGIVDALS